MASKRPGKSYASLVASLPPRVPYASLNVPERSTSENRPELPFLGSNELDFAARARSECRPDSLCTSNSEPSQPTDFIPSGSLIDKLLRNVVLLRETLSMTASVGSESFQQEFMSFRQSEKLNDVHPEEYDCSALVDAIWTVKRSISELYVMDRRLGSTEDSCCIEAFVDVSLAEQLANARSELEAMSDRCAFAEVAQKEMEARLRDLEDRPGPQQTPLPMPVAPVASFSKDYAGKDRRILQLEKQVFKCFCFNIAITMQISSFFTF